MLATLNRLHFLKRCLASVRASVGKTLYEIIIADGGSTDGTLEHLRTQKDVRLIEIGERTGAVHAFNQCFYAARGEFVAALNDDCEIVHTPLAHAVAQLRADPSIGQIAIPFITHPVCCVEEIPTHVTELPETQIVNLPNLGAVPYANFGVIARELGKSLGWWGQQYYWQYGGDTELSTQVWARGLRVVPLDPSLGYLIHWQVKDDTRVPNVETPQFNRRWRGPNSPFLKMPPVTNAVTGETRVRVRYTGKRHGGLDYQRPGSSVKYKVSAATPVFDVDAADATWMLGLKERGRRLFERVT